MTPIQLQEKLEIILSEIDAKWSKEKYEEKIFPALCEDKLKELSIEGIPSVNEIRNCLEKLVLPIQTFPALEFSDFPITFARNERFSIDLYYWMKIDTGIHNHHFNGAFKVIQGSSAQVEYKFTNNKAHGRHLTEGLIEQNKVLELKTGDTVRIEKYDDFIHQVIHLDFPTVTLCIRTNTSFQKDPLSAFILPKYKITLHELSVNKIKWILTLNLENVKNSKMLLSLDEAAYMVYNNVLKRYQIPEFTMEYLKNYLLENNFATDLEELIKQNETAALKIKKLFLLTKNKSHK